MSLLDVKNLEVEFRRGKAEPVKAVRGVSFSINPGETLGLVGESGCGKTTLSRAILGLQAYKGDVLLNNEPLDWKGQGHENRQRLQLIFQDPYASLNPRQPIGQTLEEPLRVHRKLSKRERKVQVSEMLDRVELPQNALSKYPHAFSGGQRQRIAIARALILRPEFLIADEPVSALDISVQAHILNLLLDLKTDMGLTMLFISHDLSVVRHVADRVAVMHQGRIVEEGTCREIMENPQDAYTRTLLEAVPTLKAAIL